MIVHRLGRIALTCAVAFGVSLTSAKAAEGQQTYQLTLSPGTELRLVPSATGRRVRGRVVVLQGDTLFLKEDEGTGRYSISALTSLEVRGGEDKRHGVLIGAGIATSITAVAGGIDLAHGDISGGDFVGTMIGNALIGGLIGYAFAPKGWERLPLPTRTGERPR